VELRAALREPRVDLRAVVRGRDSEAPTPLRLLRFIFLAEGGFGRTERNYQLVSVGGRCLTGCPGCPAPGLGFPQPGEEGAPAPAELGYQTFPRGGKVL
jgi:hypothetical protein